MPRDIVINGESMVTVKGNAFVSGLRSVSQLGLTSESITVSPRLYHYELKANDFGPNVPAEVMNNIAEVRIFMTLVHFDYQILRDCISESQAGMPTFGALAPAGMTLGRGASLYSSGCHWMSMSISSTDERFPWTFPTAYIPTPPLEIPLGTERSLVRLEWRAIPYKVPQTRPLGSYRSGVSQVTEILSSGAILWTNEDLL
ncbi:MAG: hypothetical protein IT447_16675 [Phycisphaerales bacterium]|nr:hypothetical protein [Phycisphaerales bacterium]